MTFLFYINSVFGTKYQLFHLRRRFNRIEMKCIVVFVAAVAFCTADTLNRETIGDNPTKDELFHEAIEIAPEVPIGGRNLDEPREPQQRGIFSNRWTTSNRDQIRPIHQSDNSNHGV